MTQSERSKAALAIDKSELCTLQGYILRACDEFEHDCPRYFVPGEL